MGFNNSFSVVVWGLLQIQYDPVAGFYLTFQREGTREVSPESTFVSYLALCPFWVQHEPRLPYPHASHFYDNSFVSSICQSLDFAMD